MTTPLPLREIFADVTRAIDGAVLTGAFVRANAALGQEPVHVLAVGKVAFPMLEGFLDAAGSVASGLVIAPEPLFPGAGALLGKPIAARLEAALPDRVGAIAADHPDPTERSVTAARAARNFVGHLSREDALCVLLSGGTSSLLCAPAGTISLEQKRAAISAVARSGAPISELNTVRKHLSSVKGGRLGLCTAARTRVLLLSDVVGDDPATIGSGPFAPDPTTYADALTIVQSAAPDAGPEIVGHLAAGADGLLEETPKPGDARLGHVEHAVVAGTRRPSEEARRLVQERGLTPGILSRDTELAVERVAEDYVDRARREAAAGGNARVLVGHGEPRVALPPNPGRGGRASHLALLVARGIEDLPGVSFLAAGTDDRDGLSDASGAVVDGETWTRAVELGLDPEGALRRFDSATVLAALGAAVRGPGTSNLGDLHLLGIAM